jgi:hypothetical protein
MLTSLRHADLNIQRQKELIWPGGLSRPERFEVVQARVLGNYKHQGGTRFGIRSGIMVAERGQAQMLGEHVQPERAGLRQVRLRELL